MDFKKNENEKYKKLDARYLAFLMGKIDGLYDKFARQYGLNYNSLGVYSAIYASQPCTQKEICGKWGLSKQTVSSICKELHKKEMLDYESSDKDKREKYVKFTEKGNKFAKPIIMELEELENGVLDEMDEESRYWIFKSSEKFYELFNKKMKEVDYE